MRCAGRRRCDQLRSRVSGQTGETPPQPKPLAGFLFRKTRSLPNPTLVPDTVSHD